MRAYVLTFVSDRLFFRMIDCKFRKSKKSEIKKVHLQNFYVSILLQNTGFRQFLSGWLYWKIFFLYFLISDNFRFRISVVALFDTIKYSKTKTANCLLKLRIYFLFCINTIVYVFIVVFFRWCCVRHWRVINFLVDWKLFLLFGSIILSIVNIKNV